MLNVACTAAEKNRQYSSADTCRLITEKFQDVFGPDRVPYDWQLNVTEALLLHLDSVVIAGTGSGKTMPFALVLMADETEKKVVIVISPLNELEKDQVSTQLARFSLKMATISSGV
ncbi:hypothetical protein WOLCODRAFT_78344 [Wolfiporia cocos MD-104 SS10]|uniref:DEAD/DEAH-box helicase domain-containing protein n=1 Tax=Wolfiporia cocos (strain MD-104) TaxID=742152 RepID=A0A2H3JSF1_WOLCO|nr:hypothetical protein WOLCODRAFT_78344 [Wolfiporia cocos MD-104 SS10]